MGRHPSTIRYRLTVGENLLLQKQHPLSLSDQISRLGGEMSIEKWMHQQQRRSEIGAASRRMRLLGRSGGF
jgi:hypothetical protein